MHGLAFSQQKIGEKFGLEGRLPFEPSQSVLSRCRVKVSLMVVVAFQGASAIMVDRDRM